MAWCQAKSRWTPAGLTLFGVLANGAARVMGFSRHGPGEGMIMHVALVCFIRQPIPDQAKPGLRARRFGITAVARSHPVYNV